MQKAELAYAPASTSAKTVKPSKPRKKGSPLDEIRKDPDAFYALLKMISREKEVADDLEDERSSKTSITKNPYYLYNQEWFDHDEEDTPDLAEDWFPYLSSLHNGQNDTMFTLGKRSHYCITLLAHANDAVFEDSLSYFRHKMPNDEVWTKVPLCSFSCWLETKKWKITIHFF